MLRRGGAALLSKDDKAARSPEASAISNTLNTLHCSPSKRRAENDRLQIDRPWIEQNICLFFDHPRNFIRRFRFFDHQNNAE
jgi:hypothetical protein